MTPPPAAAQAPTDGEMLPAATQAVEPQLTGVPAEPAPMPAPAAAAPAIDVTAKLHELTQMKEAGVLTDVEFTAAKAKLLGI